MPESMVVTMQVDDGGGPLGISKVYEDNAKFSVDLVVPAGSTNLSVPITFDTNRLKVFFALNQGEDGVDGGNLTLKTNSSSTPIETFTMVYGAPILWCSDSGLTNPLSVDITGMFVTNATANDIRLRIKGLWDATP